jgi:APA family basic amino acid/polyamine antiporter
MQYATDDRLGTAAMFGFFGNYAALIMAVFVVISTFGCNNGMIPNQNDGSAVTNPNSEHNTIFRSAEDVARFAIEFSGTVHPQ